MQTIQLNNTTSQNFEKAWTLYEAAFPIDERRTLEAQAKIMQHPNYKFEICMDHKLFLGFLLWWELDTYCYIDHFATAPQLRNQGYGKQILQDFMSKYSKPLLLEVELPTSTINQRRIGFYKRLGWVLNEHHYTVPNSEEGQPPLELLLMSYPNPLTQEDVKQFVKLCHPIIFEHS